MNITLNTVARKAKVSSSLVSAILLGNSASKSRFSKETAERVREVARQLNYRPHAGARAARTRAHHAIGVITVHTFRTEEAVLHTAIDELIDGINDVLVAEDYCFSFLKVFRLPIADSGNWPRLLAESRVDGLIVTSQAPTELQDYIASFRIPAIWVNTNLHAAHDCIYYDDAEAARTLTRHLIEKGHRRIAFLRTPADFHYSSSERRRGYLEAMRGAGLEPYPGHDRPIPDNKFPETVQAMLEGKNPPTAFMPVYGTTPIVPVIYRNGLRIPEDISLIGWFDSLAAAESSFPRLTGMMLDLYGVGARAARLVLRKIASGNAPLPSDVLKWTLCPGESVAACATDDNEAGTCGQTKQVVGRSSP